MSRTAAKHVLCVSNEGYRVGLIVRRVYVTLPDREAEERGLIRVVDESGEDYLFPRALFVAIELPSAARRVMRDEPAPSVLQRASPNRRR